MKAEKSGYEEAVGARITGTAGITGAVGVAEGSGGTEPARRRAGLFALVHGEFARVGSGLESAASDLMASLALEYILSDRLKLEELDALAQGEE